MSRKFAEGTVVSVTKSRAEIEDLLTRYGADGFAYAVNAQKAQILFTACGQRVRFDLVFPSRDSFRVNTAKPAGHSQRERTDAQVEDLFNQEMRRLWRALALVIKAKLEAVSSGIVTFESEFLAHFVLPSGNTVGTELAPQLVEMRETGKSMPLLLGGRV